MKARTLTIRRSPMTRRSPIIERSPTPIVRRKRVSAAALLASVVISAALPASASAEPAPSRTSTSTSAPHAAPDAAGAEAGEALPEAAAVTRMLDELWRAQASHARLTMTVTTGRGNRDLKLESWSSGSELVLVVVRAPAREAGVATLRTEEGLWSYAPRADRLIRVPAGLLADGWMGSHFTNDDLVRESSYQKDYDARLGWVSEGGTRLVGLTLTPKPGAPVVYTRIEFRLEPGTLVPLRADYFDGDTRVRQMNFSKVRDVAGKAVPHMLQLIPLDEKHTGEQTTLEYDSLETGVAVDSQLFSKQGLRRAAARP